MDRRTFLKSGSIAAATATGTMAAQQQAIASPHIKKDRVEITTALGPQFQKGYLRDRADRLALGLRSLSGGRIDVTFVTASEAAGAQAATGDVSAYFGSEAEHIGIDPSLGFFAGLPGDMGLKPEDFKSWLSAGGGQMHWDAVAAKQGLKSFAAGHSGVGSGLWSRNDIVLIEQISGTSLFASGLTARVGERLGFNVVASSEAADAIELPLHATAALADGRIGQSKYWFPNGMAPNGYVISFGLNRDFWDRLSASDQAIIETCTSEAFHQCVSEQTAHDREVAPVLIARRGIERRQWQDELRRAIAHTSVEVVREAAASSKDGQDLYENYMFFLQSVTGNQRITNSVGFV